MTNLPKWLTPSIKKESIIQEKKLAVDLGGKLTPCSGAKNKKGDIILEDYLVESKATSNKSISLKKEWLEKIEKEALLTNKLPLVILEISGRRYYVFREQDVGQTTN